MFAGAAREAVFSKPEVIERIKKDFIPVALKAGKVANPPLGIEGQLYRQLKLTQPAPQGICVMNSGGKALVWSLMFEDDDQVLGFLDHSLELYHEFPNSSQQVAAQRFMRFPNHQLPDVADDGNRTEIPHAHNSNESCPGDLQAQPGALLTKVIGRALGEDGKPMTDARTQDNYIEDRFHIPMAMQRDLAAAATAAGSDDRFPIPADLARVLVANAYLGQLDVNPLGGPSIRATTLKSEISLWATNDSDFPGRLQLEGSSLVSGRNSDANQAGDGRLWEHETELCWEGFVSLEDESISSFAIAASGRERIQWAIKAACGIPTMRWPTFPQALQSTCIVQCATDSPPKSLTLLRAGAETTKGLKSTVSRRGLPTFLVDEPIRSDL